MGWLLAYIAGAVIATAIAQRLMTLDDLFAPDSPAEVAEVWLLAALVGVLWPLLGPLGLLALAARALQRWYDAHLPKRKVRP